MTSPGGSARRSRWFACEKVTELKPRGVLAPIDDKNARQVLRCVVGLLRNFGYKGMAIFIDKAENVLTRGYSKSQRQVAYQNLRELLNNVNGGVSGVGLGRTLCYLRQPRSCSAARRASASTRASGPHRRGPHPAPWL